jgi:hypothetical protein
MNEYVAFIRGRVAFLCEKMGVPDFAFHAERLILKRKYTKRIVDMIKKDAEIGGFSRPENRRKAQNGAFPDG